jgi:hypothetical protein
VTDDLEAAREAAWKAYEKEVDRVWPETRTAFSAGFEAGAEWGVAAASERVQALVEWAGRSLAEYRRAHGETHFVGEGVAALAALESLGAPK